MFTHFRLGSIILCVRSVDKARMQLIHIFPAGGAIGRQLPKVLSPTGLSYYLICLLILL